MTETEQRRKRHRAYANKRYAEDVVYREKQKAYAKIYQKLHKREDLRLKRRYGITVEERAVLLANQGGKCAVCGTDSPSKIGWVVDHCHSTKRVRGILCNPCNMALGLLKDNVVYLQAAVQYLGV